jgi:hypothetical protein
MLRVRDLQQILGKFTNGQKGTNISDCPVFIETEDGHLEDLRRIEIQESVIIGDSNPARMVLKFDRDKRVRTNQQSRTFKIT